MVATTTPNQYQYLGPIIIFVLLVYVIILAVFLYVRRRHIAGQGNYYRSYTHPAVARFYNNASCAFPLTTDFDEVVQASLGKGCKFNLGLIRVVFFGCFASMFVLLNTQEGVSGWDMYYFTNWTVAVVAIYFFFGSISSFLSVIVKSRRNPYEASLDLEIRWSYAVRCFGVAVHLLYEIAGSSSCFAVVFDYMFMKASNNSMILILARVVTVTSLLLELLMNNIDVRFDQYPAAAAFVMVYFFYIWPTVVLGPRHDWPYDLLSTSSINCFGNYLVIFIFSFIFHTVWYLIYVLKKELFLLLDVGRFGSAYYSDPVFRLFERRRVDGDGDEEAMMDDRMDDEELALLNPMFVDDDAVEATSVQYLPDGLSVHGMSALIDVEATKLLLSDYGKQHDDRYSSKATKGERIEAKNMNGGGNASAYNRRSRRHLNLSRLGDHDVSDSNDEEGDGDDDDDDVDDGLKNYASAQSRRKHRQNRKVDLETAVRKRSGSDDSSVSSVSKLLSFVAPIVKRSLKLGMLSGNTSRSIDDGPVDDEEQLIGSRNSRSKRTAARRPPLVLQPLLDLDTVEEAMESRAGDTGPMISGGGVLGMISSRLSHGKRRSEDSQPLSADVGSVSSEAARPPSVGDEGDASTRGSSQKKIGSRRRPLQLQSLQSLTDTESKTLRHRASDAVVDALDNGKEETVSRARSGSIGSHHSGSIFDRLSSRLSHGKRRSEDSQPLSADVGSECAVIVHDATGGDKYSKGVTVGSIVDDEGAIVDGDKGAAVGAIVDDAEGFAVGAIVIDDEDAIVGAIVEAIVDDDEDATVGAIVDGDESVAVGAIVIDDEGAAVGATVDDDEVVAVGATVGADDEGAAMRAIFDDDEVVAVGAIDDDDDDAVVGAIVEAIDDDDEDAIVGAIVEAIVDDDEGAAVGGAIIGDDHVL